ncbi:MAG: DNA double-strand break repair nuclease NurA [Anaerolineaceae bacterium]|nr:DNA double-strand break repair nuclease NurA [Anaerolineaceae bacterium]
MAAGLLRDTLEKEGPQPGKLASLVESESATNKSLRCAKPFQESPACVHGLPEITRGITLIAADGSQINPSRHRQVEFSLINVATISLQTDSDSPSTINTESTIMDNFDLTAGTSFLTENIIALERDIRERKALLEQASGSNTPLLTLTDGPLELFRETNDAHLIGKMLGEYITILNGFLEKRVITAGYVDKPQSDLVARLLKLSIKNNNTRNLQEYDRMETIRVADINIFNPVLQNPGDRTSVFAIHSPWSKHFKDALELCFFYINVSQTDKPYLARVELPAWCASSPSLLDTLQAVVFQQCVIMGSRPYPYILHRAHELALITFEETTQLDSMLAQKMLDSGSSQEMISNKQSAKDLPGRGRYI